MVKKKIEKLYDLKFTFYKKIYGFDCKKKLKSYKENGM